MNKLLRVLTLLVVILGLGISCASAANVAVSFNPQTVELQPGSSQNIQILMNQVPANGLAGFNITVSVADQTIAHITAVSAPGWAGVSNRSKVPSGSAWITAANFNQVHAGDTNASLGNITITGIKAGTTNLNILPTEIDDNNGNLINPGIAICQVTVLGNVPIYLAANFISNITQGYAPLNVQFTDLSKNATKWNWDFGDGATSTDQNPEHTYSTAENYSVILTVNNVNDTASKTGTIKVLEDSSSSVGNNNGGSSNGGSSNGGSSNGGSSSGGSSDGGNSNLGSSNVGSSSGGSSSGGSSDGGNSNLGSSNVGSSSSGSSSGGSGGAGGSPEPQSNVETKELSQTVISSGSSVKFNFPHEVTPIVNISFDSRKTAGKTTTIVENLKGKSTLVSKLPSDEIYQYLNIWVGNGGFGESTNIGNAVIDFKVEKTWVKNKNIDKSSITLNRYNDTKWNALPTNLSREDDNYLYFTAETSGFSLFAITGKIATNEAVSEIHSGTQAEPSIGSLEQNNTSNVTNIEQTPEQQATITPVKQNTKTPGFEIIYGITAMLAVFLYKRR